jgi:hypothetical protein
MLILDQCPKCKWCYSVSYYGISTRLGPVLARCSRCHAVFQSGKIEWAGMNLGNKIIFWLLTLFYALSQGIFMGTMVCAIIVTIIYGKPEQWSPNLAMFLLFYACLVVFPALVIAIQVRRVSQSKVRTQASLQPSIAVDRFC